MNIIGITEVLCKGLIFFLTIIGILTFLYPVKITVQPPHGVLLGVVFTSSYYDNDELENRKYVFISIHLLVGSIGVFIDLG